LQAAAFAEAPAILPVSDILFDAWAMTSIRHKLPGRPDVEPYLHGIEERELPETYVAWREKVSIVTDDMLARYKPEDLIEDYPLKPHELLRDRSDRVLKHLISIVERRRHKPVPVWLLDDQGDIEPLTLQELVQKNNSHRIKYCTVLLPPEAGGLDKNGFLNGESDTADDVADEWPDEDGHHRRQRQWSDDARPERLDGMRL
jgi:CRISPR-associated endonuclease/helicase Cas3